MTVFFSGDITVYAVKRFIKKMDKKANKLQLQGLRLTRLWINLYSDGGEPDAANVLKNWINTTPYEVVICAYNEIASAAMYLFMTCNAKKVVCDNCIGMWHTGDFNTTYKDAIKGTDNFTLGRFVRDIVNENTIKLMKKLKIEEKLIRRVINNEDVYIKTDELTREAKVAQSLFYREKGIK